MARERTSDKERNRQKDVHGKEDDVGESVRRHFRF